MKNQKSTLVSLFIVFLFSTVFSYDTARASHAMGADLTYECISANQYLLTFSFYRDCVGIPAPASVDVQYSSSCFAGGSITLNPTPTSPTQISPTCSTAVSTCNGGTYTGIEEWIYTAVVTLPGPCADWTFSHDECCRNAAITTITGAGSDNMYVYSLLNNTTPTCNNSPTFSNRPVPFACVGQRFCFNHGAFDVDGDSLAYQLITPLTGPGGATVTYLPGHSNTQPVISSPPVTFDPVSGDICMTPTQAEVTVFAVLVNEYRNGVLIGQVERDIQLTVNNCNNFLPMLTGINGAPQFTATLCAGNPYSFYIASIDADAANTTTITWDFAIPGATLTMTGGHRDSAFFNWTPPVSAISGTPYCFTATVTDDNCPYQGVQIFSYCFTVQGIDPDAGPDQTVPCNVFATLNATATGGSGIYTYTWNPGNFTGQTLNNAGVGTYIVTVSDGLCSNTDTVDVFAGAGVPTADFSFTNNCSGNPVQFTDLSTVGGGSSIVNWLWDFGDGGTANTQNPTHQYTVNGNYNVTLIVQTPTNCADTLVQQLTINTNVPTAQFNAINVCQGTIMNFSDQSTGGPINAWSWDFNDPGSGGNNTSTVQNPSHSFTAPGTYQVTLNVTNTAGCSNQVQQAVTVFSNPTVSVPNAQICDGSSTTLNAPNGFSVYAWNPGGNTQAITVNPSTTSNYSLTVTDANGCSGNTVVTVTVDALPVANAGADQTICQGTNASLSGSGGGTYEWNPGNLSGSSVSVSPPSTTTYTLTVTSAAGCAGTDQVTVNVNAMPVVDAGNDNNICKGSSISLSLVSGTGSISWTPGGFTTSSITVSPGVTTTYTVTVSDAIGCSGSDQVTVNVRPVPVAAFVNSGPVCLGNAINLTDNSNISAGAITTWNWDFGDGQAASSQNPSVTYSTDGLFNVQLIVTSDFGCRDTVTNSLRVNPLPVANAGPDDDICPGFNATLNGSGGVQYLWTPGNMTTASITLSPATTTDYVLQVTDANGCTNTDQARIVVNPVPVANAGTDQDICLGTATSLVASGGTDYLWSPGNVNTAVYTISPAVTTTYDVLVTNTYGCQASDQVTVNVHPIPVAAFSDDGPVCQLNTVSFTDNSNVSAGSITSWDWDLGNNVTSSVQNPSLQYNLEGNYTVNLIVTTNAGCRDTITRNLLIWPNPVASYTNLDVCDGNPVIFANTSYISDATPLSYQWSLGDSSTSSTTSPSHLYGGWGSYQADLQVTSVNGCTSDVSRTVNVFALPDAAFSAPPVCEETAFTLSDNSSIPSGAVSTWYWTLGDGSTATDPNPNHTYPDPGFYPIHLLITSNHGCQDSTDAIIRVIPKPVPDFLTESLCYGFPVQLTDQSYAVTGSVVQYQWGFGDGATSADQNPVHLYNRPGWYQVSLTITSDSGCISTLVRPNALEIFAPPNVQFESNVSAANDIYPLVNFINQTGTAGQYFWDFGDGTQSTDYSPTHLYPDIGVYQVQLISINDHGCVDTTLQRIEIRPSSNVYIPNAFTPNGDTRNDLFRVYSYNVEELQAQIFDRWGLKVFEWDTIDGGWDGKVEGNPAQADVYVYRVTTVDINNRREVRIGHVSLVR